MLLPRRSNCYNFLFEPSLKNPTVNHWIVIRKASNVVPILCLHCLRGWRQDAVRVFARHFADNSLLRKRALKKSGKLKITLQRLSQHIVFRLSKLPSPWWVSEGDLNLCCERKHIVTDKQCSAQENTPRLVNADFYVCIISPPSVRFHWSVKLKPEYFTACKTRKEHLNLVPRRMKNTNQMKRCNNGMSLHRRCSNKSNSYQEKAIWERQYLFLGQAIKLLSVFHI